MNNEVRTAAADEPAPMFGANGPGLDAAGRPDPAGEPTPMFGADGLGLDAEGRPDVAGELAPMFDTDKPGAVLFTFAKTHGR